MFIFLLLLFLDQLIKLYFHLNCSIGQAVMLFDKPVLLYMKNFGMIFGLCGDKTYTNKIVIAYSIFIIMFMTILYFYYQNNAGQNKVFGTAFFIWCAGAVSNTFDRITFGFVVDYIVTPIGIANLADFYILCGIIIMFFDFNFHRYIRSFLFMENDNGEEKK